MAKRSSCLYITFTLLLAGACLLAVLAGGVAWLLPQQVEQTFGRPRSGLSEWQRIVYSLQLLRGRNELTRPLDQNATPQPFRVELGEPAAALAQRLQDAGLLSDASAWLTYLAYSGLDTSLQAGDYTLSAAMTPLQIAQGLQDATPATLRFGILPGWRLEEIAAVIPTSGLQFNAEEFLRAARQPASSYDAAIAVPAGTTMEGFFYPDVYEFSRDITLEGFIQIVLINFNLKVDSELRSGFAAQGLDLYEAITLASIVEREAVFDDEMTLIASVFHNRLASGMKLETDPTVQYALGYNEAQHTWWTNPLSASDLQVISPYNTYRVAGLPPGPIANPSLNALRAVAFPASSPYFYFRAACDDSGLHLFAETFEQHVQNGCP